METDIDFILDYMKKYLLISSPGCYTKEAILEAKEDFKNLGF